MKFIKLSEVTGNTIYVNVSLIRELSPRKTAEPGTQIYYRDDEYTAVHETQEEVLELINGTR